MGSPGDSLDEEELEDEAEEQDRDRDREQQKPGNGAAQSVASESPTGSQPAGIEGPRLARQRTGGSASAQAGSPQFSSSSSELQQWPNGHLSLAGPQVAARPARPDQAAEQVVDFAINNNNNNNNSLSDEQQSSPMAPASAFERLKFGAAGGYLAAGGGQLRRRLPAQPAVAGQVVAGSVSPLQSQGRPAATSDWLSSLESLSQPQIQPQQKQQQPADFWAGNSSDQLAAGRCPDGDGHDDDEELLFRPAFNPRLALVSAAGSGPGGGRHLSACEQFGRLSLGELGAFGPATQLAGGELRRRPLNSSASNNALATADHLQHLHLAAKQRHRRQLLHIQPQQQLLEQQQQQQQHQRRPSSVAGPLLAGQTEPLPPALPLELLVTGQVALGSEEPIGRHGPIKALLHHQLKQQTSVAEPPTADQLKRLAFDRAAPIGEPDGLAELRHQRRRPERISGELQLMDKFRPLAPTTRNKYLDDHFGQL